MQTSYVKQGCVKKNKLKLLSKEQLEFRRLWYMPDSQGYPRGPREDFSVPGWLLDVAHLLVQGVLYQLIDAV